MITLVDYKAGNLTSVRRALTHLGIACQISADPEQVRRADKIIFPGVGAAGAAMGVLRQRGLDSALKEAFANGAPILGICIGCQIILEHSEEDDAECLGLLAGRTVKFQPSPLTPLPPGEGNADSPLPMGEGDADSPPQMGEGDADSPPQMGEEDADSPLPMGEGDADSPPQMGEGDADSPPQMGEEDADSPPPVGEGDADSPPPVGEGLGVRERLKIPHMGWNAVGVLRPHPLLSHLRPGDEFYFVHSYYPQPANPDQIYATSNYGGEFPVAIGRDNLFAVQFHTEKSGAVGLRVLENFSEW